MKTIVSSRQNRLFTYLKTNIWWAQLQLTSRFVICEQILFEHFVFQSAKKTLPAIQIVDNELSKLHKVHTIRGKKKT